MPTSVRCGVTALGRTVDTMEDPSSTSSWRSEGKPLVEPLCCECWLDCCALRAISVLLCVLTVLVVSCRRLVFLVANRLLVVVGFPQYRTYVSVLLLHLLFLVSFLLSYMTYLRTYIHTFVYCLYLSTIQVRLSTLLFICCLPIVHLSVFPLYVHKLTTNNFSSPVLLESTVTSKNNSRNRTGLCVFPKHTLSISGIIVPHTTISCTSISLVELFFQSDIDNNLHVSFP